MTPAQAPRRPARRRLLAAAPITALALLAAACGGSGDTAAGDQSAPLASETSAATSASSSSPSSASSASGSSTGTAAGATVAVAEDDQLGEILVDSDGRTLYLFEQDSGGMSTCFDACAEVWPPLTTEGEPQAGQGAMASLLTTTSRPDGTTQVVYNGNPLYFYTPDSQPGDTLGQGLNQFGAEWYVLSPQGEKVENGES